MEWITPENLIILGVLLLIILVYMTVTGAHITVKDGKVSVHMGGRSKDRRELYDLLKAVTLDVLRLTFYSNASDEVRLIAGLRYIKDGGNGMALRDVREYIEQHKDVYDGIVVALPELKVPKE